MGRGRRAEAQRRDLLARHAGCTREQLVVARPGAVRARVGRLVEARQHGLVGAHTLAGRDHRGRQRAREHGLADTRVGRCNEQPAHPAAGARG